MLLSIASNIEKRASESHPMLSSLVSSQGRDGIRVQTRLTTLGPIHNNRKSTATCNSATEGSHTQDR
eukprot:4471488-Karenia_brevis.AAC.1